MTEKRYYTVDYGEEFYIFDSNVIRKDTVKKEVEYCYEVFGNSMTGDEIVDLLNNYDAKLTEIEEIVKNFDKFWVSIPKGYSSSAKGAYIVMEKMLETIDSIREKVNNR